MSMFKKLVALGMVTTMIAGSALTAFAADPTEDVGSSGSGAAAGAERTVEGAGTANYLFKKVFKVTVPTNDEANKIFDYYTDPQGLIAETNAAQIGTNVSIAADTGVFFTNAGDGGAVSLSNVSDPLRLVNKSTSGVSIAMKVKLEAAASDPYATGYSSTADFSGSGDSTKGLYLGLMTSGNKLTALTDTEATPTSVMASSYPLYQVTWDATNSEYKFAIPSESADASPAFDIYAVGALNKALADTTWYKATTGQPLTEGDAYAMPKISVKYTPTYIDAKMGLAVADADNLYVLNYDGTPFKASATVASVKINNVTPTTATPPTACNSDGILIIPIASVYEALGLTTADEKTFDNVQAYLKGVSATIGGVDIYADVSF